MHVVHTFDGEESAFDAVAINDCAACFLAPKHVYKVASLCSCTTHAA